MAELEQLSREELLAVWSRSGVDRRQDKGIEELIGQVAKLTLVSTGSEAAARNLLRRFGV